MFVGCSPSDNPAAGGRAFFSGPSPTRGDILPRVSPGEPITLLVADDEPLLLQLVQRVLALDGYAVLEAADGDVALQQLDAATVAGVVLDVTMPPDGGEAILGRMLALRPDLCVVLTSGAAPPPSLREMLRKQNGVYLAKPFSPQALLAAVRTALQRAGRG